MCVAPVTYYSPYQLCGHPLENVFHFLDVTIFGMNPANLLIDDVSLNQYRLTHKIDASKERLFYQKVSQWFMQMAKGSQLDFETLYRQYCTIRKETLLCELPIYELTDLSTWWIDQSSLLEEDLAKANKVFVVATCYQKKDVFFVKQMFEHRHIQVDWLTLDQSDEIYMSTSQLVDQVEPSVSVVEFDSEKQLKQWLKEQGQNYDFGICIGETLILQYQSVNVDLYFLADVHHFFVRVLTSLYDAFGKVLIYQPKETSMIQYNPIIHDSMYNYHIQNQLIQSYGRSVASLPLLEAIRLNPGFFYDLYRKSEKPKILLSQQFESVEAFAAYKRQIVCEKLLKHQIEYKTAGYDMATMKSVDVRYTEGSIKPRIVCDALIVHEKKPLSVLYQNELPLKSPRYIIDDQKPKVVTNFLFYTTSMLLKRENQLRIHRPKEKIPFKETHFDVLFQKGSKHGYQFPLYNKAALMMDELSNISIERIRFKEGLLTINQKTFYVNNDDHQEVYVMTPMEYIPDETNSFVVGHDRLNLVIVKEDLVAARFGDVLLPSVGVVVSIHPDGQLARQLVSGCEVDDQGYVDITGWTYQLQLLNLPPVDLLIGGGLLLMDHGEMVYEESIEVEGWKSPLSIMTQESDIQNLSIHPRTAIGLTTDGKLCVFVFSGRSQFSIGANYRHMCLIIKDMVPTIDKVMNVDGGASSFLAYVDPKGFVELNVPSATFDTCAGRVRNVYSMLEIEC